LAEPAPEQIAMRIRVLRTVVGISVVLLAAACAAAAETKRILILHTNDVHDHVRAGENGLGGLPYVSGYIRQVREGRDDVLVLDGGDVAEKGDLVAFRTHSELTYEAMSRVGYHAVTIGNHEFDEYGFAGMRKFEAALKQPVVCINLLDEQGRPAFEPSRLINVGTARVGVIGAIVPRSERCLDFAATGRAFEEEAVRLRRRGAELVVVVCHESERKCREWSRMAPSVQVFVSGHSHQALHQPLVVPETGARIVQAGSYARWVGRLEVEFDPATGKVVAADGRLVEMRHDSTPVDAEMLAAVKRREAEIAPEAARFVVDNPAEIDGFSVARLGAEALRVAANADVGFCHPYQVIRNVLPPGRVDVNAIFKTGGHRGHHTLMVELSGRQIAAYVSALLRVQREPPEWSGFQIERRARADGGEDFVPLLDPERVYRVVMPRIEWETRYLRLGEKLAERDAQHPLAARVATRSLDVTFTGAVEDYIRATLRDGDAVQQRIKKLERAREAEPVGVSR
jgi:2',3'-cyclic-nucleotide 2'-phosphodiesterase (5'-nucleotidase family)